MNLTSGKQVQFIEINKGQLKKFESELRPDGKWFFPADLEGLVLSRVMWEEKKYQMDCQNYHWQEEIFIRMASEIGGAYRDDSEVTDYSSFWRSYALYYLPNNFSKIIRILLELLQAGMLPRHLRLLDLGVGPGTVPLAVLYFYSRLAKYTWRRLIVEINLVDRFPYHLAIAQFLLKDYSRGINTVGVTINQTLTGCLERGREQLALGLGQTKYNLIFLSNVLNEYEISDINKNKKITDFALNYLAKEGTLAIVEPALERCARRLADLHWQYMQTTNGVKAAAFAPCAYPWGRYPSKSKSCQCWSFVNEPWQRPSFLSKLERLGAPRRKEIKFSYLLLRLDKRNKYRYLRKPEYYHTHGYTRLSRLSGSIDKITSVVGVAIHLYRNGNRLLINLCDGTAGNCSVCCLQVDQQNSFFQELLRVKHGDFLALINVQVTQRTQSDRFILSLTDQSAVHLNSLLQNIRGDVIC